RKQEDINGKSSEIEEGQEGQKDQESGQTGGSEEEIRRPQDREAGEQKDCRAQEDRKARRPQEGRPQEDGRRPEGCRSAEGRGCAEARPGGCAPVYAAAIKSGAATAGPKPVAGQQRSAGGSVEPQPVQLAQLTAVGRLSSLRVAASGVGLRRELGLAGHLERVCDRLIAARSHDTSQMACRR